MEYFLDHMERWEAMMLLRELNHANVPGWEQARMLMWMIAGMFSKKKLGPKDVIKFPWDSEAAKDTSISNEEVARLKERMNTIRNGNNTYKTDKR